MPVAGTAFDGSPWVTAASSIGLGAFLLAVPIIDNLISHNSPINSCAVVTSLGLAVLGGTVIARKTLDGVRSPLSFYSCFYLVAFDHRSLTRTHTHKSLGLPTDMGVPDAVQRRRSIPLEKSGDRSPSDVGTSPESVDFLQSNDVKE